MTLESCNRGFTFYLTLLEHNKVGGVDRLGGVMQKPKMRKGRHPLGPKLGLPGDMGSYTVVHKGTKEWP
jgi:hypothetical protein